ncbi:MAG: AMP-dependent synthetase/ligase [Planctomycetota bacterium]
MQTINRYAFRALKRHAARPLQISADGRWTYAEAARAAQGVASELERLGVQKGDRVALLAENSPRWLHAFLGVLARGAVAVPRGEETPQAELRWILRHSGARVAFVGSPRIAARVPAGVACIPLFGEGFPTPAAVTGEVLGDYAEAARPDDLAVLLYTSGTTGRPKGVMLEQRNIAHNLRCLPPLVRIETGDLWVTILPPWHTFELTVELCSLALGCTTVYSDKRRFRSDLREHRPQFFAAVPRIWESLCCAALDGIRKRSPAVRALWRLCFGGSRLARRQNPLGVPLHALGKRLFYDRMAAATGGRLKYGISGGGAMPAHVDEFFAVAGVTIRVGYGLTETAPVVAVRRPERNILGTIGQPLPETEVRVGPQGTFQVRGPQVMRGYYGEEEATARVLDVDGWLDTGDLGRITPDGDLVFAGRLKETIVLAGGENVEPEALESRILEHPAVAQVMVVGQDRKTLGALIAPTDHDAGDPDLERALREALLECTGERGGFRGVERVTRFRVLSEPFTVENGLLTPTLKMRRNEIAARYAAEIDALYR